MKYLICEWIDGQCVPIVDENGERYQFASSLKANEERCYLQPDYDNHLIVKEI